MALFMWRGTGAAFWLPANIQVAAGGPTTAQIEDGIDLTDGINAMAGFEPSSSPINVPVLRSRQSYQIPGERTFGTPSITVVEDDGTDAIALARQLILETLEQDEEGTLVILRNTQTPGTGDVAYWVRATVDSQVPGLTLDAAAATTVINLTPQEELRKGVVNPTGS